MQQTLASVVSLVGTGLHTGRPARLRVRPAPANHGIVFMRTDITGRDNLVPARWNSVSDTVLNTRISNADDVTVSTVEHIMAAFAGCGVHNALVEIDGPEVPVFDGSSLKFAKAFLDAGLDIQDQPLRVLVVKKPVRVERGDAYAELLPSKGFEIDFTIEFDDPMIGRQSLSKDMCNGTFLRELADCRTFCRKSEVDALRANGLALGGTLQNAVVIDKNEVLTPGGFRRADECVRHKMLDALGDLCLAGNPILGRYEGHKAGHAMTNALLRKLFATPDAFITQTASAAVTELLPGTHLQAQDLAVVG